MSDKELHEEQEKAKEETTDNQDSITDEQQKPEQEKVEEKQESVEEISVVADSESTEADGSTKSEESDSEEDDHEEHVASSDEVHTEETEEDHHPDYHSLTKEQLLDAFRDLLKASPVQEIKSQVEEIRHEFNAKFKEQMEEEKEKFLAEGGNIIDFHFTTPLRKTFNSIYFDYKEKRNKYYQNLKRDLQANLEKRLELIEELKSLLNAEENINSTYRHFKEIQDRWFTAGPIPRDKYNNVWNTYHHHVENFYDFLHLNREFRDLDFKHNLEEKLKLIDRAEELEQEEDIPKAFRELQMLHKLWKEEIGPVAKEFREDIWDRFSKATKVIHDKRHDYMQAMESVFEDNFLKKQEMIDAIKSITDSTKPGHQNWQNAIRKVQEFRDSYFEIGKVPRNKNKEIWTSFKEATRAFNKAKNDYYKNQKKTQFSNLEKKMELVEIAEANKDNDDFEATTPLMKKIQADWKTIGHVPRKDSDRIWKRFKQACNAYFDKLHAQKNKASEEEMAHFEKKTVMLEELDKLKLSGERDADLSLIKEKINEWKSIGRVPFQKKSIEQKFNKTLDGLFKKLDLSKSEAEMIRFENKLSSMASREDDRQLQNEHVFVSKKIDETKHEIRQLENNLGFFQHVDDSNPLVKEVHKNIARHKEKLEVWKAKLRKIKSVRNS